MLIDRIPINITKECGIIRVHDHVLNLMRRICGLPSNTHNVIIHNLTYNIDDQLDARIAKFIHMCLNHDNDICRFTSLSKLLCKNSSFASNYSYLSCKYNLSHHDWHLDTSHLIGKVRLKKKQKSYHIWSCPRYY